MATASFNLAPGESSTDAQLRRRLAIQQLQEGTSAEPVRHWTQGAARLANALIGGMDLASEDAKDQKEKDEARDLYGKIDQLTGQGGSPSRAAQAAAVSGDASPAGSNVTATPPMGKLPALGSRVYSENEMSPLDAAVATPKELAAGVNAPPQYASLIGKAAIDNDLPPNLLAAQIKQESSFNPRAVSPAGAQGVSQFMPATAKEMGINPLNPEEAIPAGAKYLRQNIDKFGGDVPTGLAAYNAGPGRVERAGGDISQLPPETRNYVTSILKNEPSPTTQVRPPSSVLPEANGVSPQPTVDRKVLAAMLQNKFTAPLATQIYGQILTQQLAPKEATWGEVGTDADGNKVMGWINSRTRSVEAVPVKPTAPTGGAPAPAGLQIPSAPENANVKEWRKEYTAAAAKNAASGNLPGTSAEATGMRKELQDVPSYKNMSAAMPIYKAMSEAAGRDTRAADLNLVYGLAKIMDPTSVVREGEINLAQATATLPQQLRAQIESQLTGEGRLKPDVREAMLQEAYGRMQAYNGVYQQDMDHFRGIAGRNRLNPDDVIRDFGKFEPWKRAPAPATMSAPPTATTPPTATAPPAGTTSRGIPWRVQ